jgi:hypothetical protein
VKAFVPYLAVGVLVCAVSDPSHAQETMHVTSGALQFGDVEGQLDLRAQADLTMNGDVFADGGQYRPGDCRVPECFPGTTVSLHASWSGGDLMGTATLRGHDYVLASEGPNGSAGIANFEGSVVLPEFTSSGTADVSAPFTFNGQLKIGEAGETDLLTGGGTATLHLRLSAEGPNWVVDSATYQFEPVKTKRDR